MHKYALGIVIGFLTMTPSSAQVVIDDASAIMRLPAEDVVIHEGGNVEGRAQYVADHLPADIEFEQSVSSKRGPIRAVVVGDAAWAMSTSEHSGTFRGRPVDSIGTELIVLSRVADSWRVRAIAWTGRQRQAG